MMTKLALKQLRLKPQNSCKKIKKLIKTRINKKNIETFKVLMIDH